MSLCLNKNVENELRAMPGNNICCDCDGKMPQWASVSFGVFMCLECSGRHRALGVHISFVRSVSMDSWSEKQINMMRAGGNDKCIAFLKQYGVAKDTMIAQKYNSPAALLYRDRLSAEVEGRPLPTQLPSPASSGYSSNNGSTKSVTSQVAGGTDPLPGETEAQYVARQRQLQEEARERMRQKFGGSTGLSSSGRMQGIGSDANYNPDAQQGSGGIDYSAASQQAFLYLQSSIAFVGDTVSKTARAYSESPSQSADTPPPAPNKTWSMLASGAVDLWNKAAVVANDAVISLTNNEEDDGRFPRAEELRFPRPEGTSTPTTTGGSKYTGISSDSYRNNSSQNNSSHGSVNSFSSGSNNNNRVSSSSPYGNKKNESWDDLDDLLDSNRDKDNHFSNNYNKSGGGIAFDETEHTSNRVAALKLENPSRTKPIPASNSRGTLSSNHNSVDNLTNHSPPSGTNGSPNKLNSSGSSSVGSGGHVKPPVASASPVGDDFFNSFGI